MLVSLNISKDASLELLVKTFLTFKKNRPIDYRVRFHPRMGSSKQIISELMRIYNWKVIPKNILIKSCNSIQEDLHWADVVLLQGSGVELEAAIYGWLYRFS